MCDSIYMDSLEMINEIVKRVIVRGNRDSMGKKIV